ncbi:hypothetical protein [Streptomyces virginiae]|uniref:DUF732 domain-containing protein n=1 Tax=Streptomyces virginiae TaxID=1961 RepID=A0ABZ1TFK2_STRVG|nr:hypothetical protein [Streptomyces virginiae]
MHRHHITSAAVTAAALLVLTGCSSITSEPKPTDKVASPTAPAATTSADPDAARAAAGLPAEPKGPARQAFLDGLNAIDKDIVHGKDDKAISRGIDTCGLIKDHPKDPAKQIEQTNKRWTSPTHPDGHGQTMAAKILAVTHTAICPTY